MGRNEDIIFHIAEGDEEPDFKPDEAFLEMQAKQNVIHNRWMSILNAAPGKLSSELLVVASKELPKPLELSIIEDYQGSVQPQPNENNNSKKTESLEPSDDIMLSPKTSQPTGSYFLRMWSKKQTQTSSVQNKPPSP